MIGIDLKCGFKVFNSLLVSSLVSISETRKKRKYKKKTVNCVSKRGGFVRPSSSLVSGLGHHPQPFGRYILREHFVGHVIAHQYFPCESMMEGKT